jgi:3-methylcrotonyl-CoA carboxylase alpha subunit
MFTRGSLDNGGMITAYIDGVRLQAVVLRNGDALQILLAGESHRLHTVTAAGAGPQTRGGLLTAPMPGRIVAVHVGVGEKVRAGQSLIVLEAMKMEHIITAPADGVVAAIHHGADDQVDEGAELLSLTSQ